MNTWSVTAANIICSTASRVPSPAGVDSAVASTRSAASLDRVSMKRRYQPARRSAGMSAPRSRSMANRGGRLRVSRDTNARPCTSAIGRSASSRSGIKLAIATSTVRPAPQPASRYVVPKSMPARTISAGSTPAASRPSTDLAVTSVSPSSSPSCKRARRCPTRSPSGRDATKTWPSSIVTSKARASSANRSSVQPEARSKRA